MKHGVNITNERKKRMAEQNGKNSLEEPRKQARETEEPASEMEKIGQRNREDDLVKHAWGGNCHSTRVYLLM